MLKLRVLLAAAFVLAWGSLSYAGIQNDSLEADFGFRVALQFAHVDLANGTGVANKGFNSTSIAGTRDTSAASQANTEYVMPFAGRIIGISVASNAALTRGAATWEPTINGTPVGDATRVSLSQAGTGVSQYNYTNLVDRFTKSSPYTFSAGDRIGVAQYGDRSNAPSTADIVVTVIVDQNAQE